MEIQAIYLMQHYIAQGGCKMKINMFAEEIQRGVEKRVREAYGESIVRVKTVTKNNNVRMKAVSIERKGEIAAPTIFLDGYFEEYKKGKSVDCIIEEIVQIYNNGIERFNGFSTKDFADFEKIKQHLYYKIINFEMNRDMLKKVPHYSFLDFAIVFYIEIESSKDGQATALIYNTHMESWNKTKEQIKEYAFHNTWDKYPYVIKRMEDIISDMILGDIISDFENGTDGISEELVYDGYSYNEVEDMVREEVENLKVSDDIEMYVLTNTEKYNGATCITYPGVLKEFAREKNSDLYVIPSSIHEAIIVVGTEWNKETINTIINEVNAKQVDPVEVLSDHVYIFSRELETLYY